MATHRNRCSRTRPYTRGKECVRDRSHELLLQWAEMELIPEATAARVVNLLRKLFCREGVPKQIVADNVRQFISREFGEFLEEWGVDNIKTPVYPQSQRARKAIQANPSFSHMTHELWGDKADRGGGSI